MGMAKKTTEQFIQEATTKHNGKYSYSKTKYIGVMLPVTITCPIHGDFNTTPNRHLSVKQGCTKCSKKYRPTTNEFIHDMIIVHNGKYDYKKTVYGKNNIDKVTVTCPTHGDFRVTPRNHRSGNGCPNCANGVKGKYHKKDTVWFVNTANAIHGTKYDYSQVKYQRYHDKVKIICPTHGPFMQTTGSHLHSKCGCPECGKEKAIGGYGEQRFKNHPEIKSSPAILYLVKMQMEGEEFLKIGITQKTINDRFIKDNKIPYDFSTINIKNGSLYKLFKQEQKIKKQLSNYKHRPKIKFNGHTECFSLECLGLLKEEIKNEYI